MAGTAVPTESFPAGLPAAGGRRTHISFPPVDPSSDADSFGDHSSIGLGPPPPSRRVVAGLGVSSPGELQTEGRRRVRSANVPSALSGRTGTQPHRHAMAPRRRTLTNVDPIKPLKADKGRWAADSVESSFDELEPGVFSDEYELCEYRISFCLTFDIHHFFLAAHEGEIHPYSYIPVPTSSLQTPSYSRTSNAL